MSANGMHAAETYNIVQDINAPTIKLFFLNNTSNFFFFFANCQYSLKTSSAGIFSNIILQYNTALPVAASL